jgi:hypothetical protein
MLWSRKAGQKSVGFLKVADASLWGRLLRCKTGCIVRRAAARALATGFFTVSLARRDIISPRSASIIWSAGESPVSSTWRGMPGAQ